MSNEPSAGGDAFGGVSHIERMLRVSPLTIGAVYKRGSEVGQGYVLNLSQGGVFLTARSAFGLGETFRLRFFLPFQLGQVDALVVVRWRTQDSESPPKSLREGMGLEFVEIDAEKRERIGAFIDKFVELAEKLGDG